MLGKRLINSNSAAGATCTTDTLQILGDTSCVAYYKMSDATDESGNYDGTPTSVNFNVAGKFGNAGEFNGSSSYIDTTYTIPASSTYTISAWFKTSTTNTQEIIIADFDASGSGLTVRFTLGFVSSNNFFINMGNGSSSWSSYTTNALPYRDGNWHNIVTVWNGTNVKLYADGNTTPIADLTSTVSAGAAGTSPLNFGRAGDVSGSYFNGSIDQVRIFNKALTSSEVTTLYNEVQCVPTIVPTDYFNTVTWTSTGNTDISITGVGFKPDLVWGKARTDAYTHTIYDSVRGAGAAHWLSSALTNSESSLESTALQYGYLDSFDLDGFSSNAGTSDNSYFNYNTNKDYVAWCWKAGGAAVLNQEGAIDSQVSANVDGGFSIVQYSGAATLNPGHGLNLAPNLIITKGQSAVEDWYVYSSDTGTGKYQSFTRNDDGGGTGNDAVNSNANAFSAVTDTTFTHSVTSASLTYIAYCFHSVDGMSRVGSYVGTGASGNSIVTGFRPAFVMIKGAVTPNATSWWIFDNKRNTTNPLGKGLLPNSSAAEQAQGTYLDFNSNGFTWLSGSGEFNDIGNTFIFMAFAEEVFNPNGVTRNATNPFGDASELALYKFEDNANDAEGSYNGTASNVTYATGYIDKAAVFNGSSSYISASNPFSGQSGAGQEYSISLWFKADSFSKQYPTLFKGRGTGETPPYVWTDGSTIRFHGYRYGDATVSLNTGQWYHLAVIENNGVVSGYLDGTSITFANQSIWNQTNGANLFIGGDPNSSSYYFDGKIDQVRIFDRVLDSGEITQLYNE